ncbi:MAG: molybdenum ABC transporter substrate-binding protein [Firmicutes bacterium ML8_F2]|jgi:molybdate transport system substrate-binding protein|nr:MAG: molybdenum ABC transporter substrate-binding protein [Firmicutes bacterium ML8_F2]
MTAKLFKVLTVVIIVTALALVIIGGGCGSQAEQLDLFVAAGLKKPMDEVIAIFQEETGIEVIPNYGPSGGLYTQIEEDQPCDLYFSADWVYIEKLEEVDRVAKSEKFLLDHEVLVVSETGREKVSCVEDLLKPGVVVGICEPTAPGGFYAETALKNMGLWDELVASGNLKARPSTVNQLALMIEENELDAGLNYSSVTKLNGQEFIEEIPLEYTGDIIFGAAVLKDGDEELAQKFLETAFEHIDEFTVYGWQPCE